MRNVKKDAVPLIRYEFANIRIEMRLIAPVDTGYLRSHIVKHDLRDGAMIESEAPYSGFLEYGTSRMRAQPFFRGPLITGIRRLMRNLKSRIVKFV